MQGFLSYHVLWMKHMMIKNMKRLLLFLLAAVVLSFTGCSSDDETEIETEIEGSGLVGRWRFVEMLDGPKGATQPNPHIMEINSDGKIVFTNDNGESNTYTYVYDDNSKYSTEMRVILINQIFEEKVYQVPYACEIGNTTLKLHYFGPYFTDHIPETFVYKRIK